MVLTSYEDIRDFCSLIHPVIKIPLFFIDDNGFILYEVSGDTPINPLSDFRDSIFSEIKRKSQKTPYTLSSKYLENYLVINVETDPSKTGYLIIGPTIPHLVSEAFDSILDTKISPREKAALIKYYKLLPIVNYHDLIKLGIFIHYLIYKKIIDFDSINIISNVLKNVQSKVDNEFSIQYRDINYHRRSSFFEKFFYSLVKNGETEKLKELLKLHSLDGEYIVLAKNNPLRSWKNLVICFITICCRAAMEGGLPTETTYALSDVYIQELEDLASIKDVEDFASKVFLDLTDRVRRLKEQKHSKLITMCQNYVSKNLNENISLSVIAKQLNVSKTYLSNQFRKEVGIPLSDYILKEKISEAKRMLLYTQFPILEIYMALGFCDQSHFTKVFKRVTGLTPKQFRDSYSSSMIWY